MKSGDYTYDFVEFSALFPPGDCTDSDKHVQYYFKYIQWRNEMLNV